MGGQWVYKKISAAIVGASGYTGAELLRLLLLHPRVEISTISARTSAGHLLEDVFPQFRGRFTKTIEAFDARAIASQADVAFTALPHGDSARVVSDLRQRGVKVIDLSADFRLSQVEVYNQWYGSEGEPTHPCPQLLATAKYGLPELHRETIAGAELVAAPGCYPTGAILAVAPLLKTGLVEPSGLIVDAKSGVTGAGRKASLGTHMAEIGEGIRAYGIAGTHRHTPEMEQELSAVAGEPVRLSFSPHLVPMSRGILSCVYATPSQPNLREPDYRAVLEEFYRDEPFVSVLPADRLPDTAHVRGSNRVHVAVRLDARAGRVVCVSAIDNLCKGSSGQAIQCLNLMQGWPEDCGLQAVASFP